MCGKSIDIKLEEIMFSKLCHRACKGDESAAAQRGLEKGVRDARLMFATEIGTAWMGNTYPGYVVPQNPMSSVRAAPWGLCSVPQGRYVLRGPLQPGGHHDG